MKKIVSIIFSMALITGLNAQEETVVEETSSSQPTMNVNSSSSVELKSKKGLNILPEAGEIGLSVDANPFLDYVGGIFSSNDASTPYFAVPADNQYIGITGKYFLDSKTAVRASFLSRVYSTKTIYDDVLQNVITPDLTNPLYVDDIVTYSRKEIGLAVGLEKRRGSSRVQGIYGAEAGFRVSTSKSIYEYGNAIDNNFPTPETYSNTYGALGERIVESASTNVFEAGARGFVGVEFFFGPKISLGSEFGIAAYYSGTNYTQNVYDYFNIDQQSVQQVVRESSSDDNKSFGLTTILDANINLNFYF